MIRLGLRLTLGGGREAALRALVTAAAVALGVCLLLMALAGVNGLQSQTQRGAWLDTSSTTPSTTGASASDPLWWLLSVDQFGDQAIDRVDVATTGPSSPVPPGLAHLPGPGQYYASPALERLLASTPADQLAERFPGHQTGTIGAAGLPSPNSLIIVIGHDSHELSQVPGAVEVRGIQRTPASCNACKSGAGSAFALQWILAIGAVALLLPVLILISTASRLSAARREERFAAMRLVGATPRQISVISAVEATVAAFAGVAFGFVLFLLLRPLLYHVPFTGAPLAAGDLSLRATRHRTRRSRRTDRSDRVRTPRATASSDLAARSESTNDNCIAAGLQGHPASRRNRLARLLRRRRKAGQQQRTGARVAPRLRTSCRRAGASRAVVHHGRRSTHDLSRCAVRPHSSPVADSSTTPRRPSGSSVGSSLLSSSRVRPSGH